VALPPLSLYVHLPWCERKCPYCDFNSHEATELPEAAYTDQLLTDLAAEYSGEERAFSSVFIGGGTPSLFSVGAIGRLLDGVRTVGRLDEHAEVTLEANPGSTERAKLAAFARAGVTRFSLGVQSFSNASLSRLGRIHDADAATAACAAAAVSGAHSFNIDLMHGLPGQDAASGLGDIAAALALSPPHLSWYQLTIERNTRFYRERPLLPAEDVLATIETRGAEMLDAAGYRRYEVSAWAQPGQECRHNLNYWEFGDYLAIGAGAHGKITAADGAIHRYHKTRLPADYLRPGGTRRVAVRALDRDDRLGEFLLGALRLRGGFSTDLFEARTGIDARLLRQRAATAERDGLLEWQGDRLRCTALGWRFLDQVVARFF
jgi:oxygen-independent coproporphyrinogen-3 oxidase